MEKTVNPELTSKDNLLIAKSLLRMLDEHRLDCENKTKFKDRISANIFSGGIMSYKMVPVYKALAEEYFRKFVEVKDVNKRDENFLRFREIVKEKTKMLPPENQARNYQRYEFLSGEPATIIPLDGKTNNEKLTGIVTQVDEREKTVWIDIKGQSYPMGFEEVVPGCDLNAFKEKEENETPEPKKITTFKEYCDNLRLLLETEIITHQQKADCAEEEYDKIRYPRTAQIFVEKMPSYRFNVDPNLRADALNVSTKEDLENLLKKAESEYAKEIKEVQGKGKLIIKLLAKEGSDKVIELFKQIDGGINTRRELFNNYASLFSRELASYANIKIDLPIMCEIRPEGISITTLSDEIKRVSKSFAETIINMKGRVFYAGEHVLRKDTKKKGIVLTSEIVDAYEYVDVALIGKGIKFESFPVYKIKVVKKDMMRKFSEEDRNGREALLKKLVSRANKATSRALAERIEHVLNEEIENKYNIAIDKPFETLDDLGRDELMKKVRMVYTEAESYFRREKKAQRENVETEIIHLRRYAICDGSPNALAQASIDKSIGIFREEVVRDKIVEAIYRDIKKNKWISTDRESLEINVDGIEEFVKKVSRAQKSAVRKNLIGNGVNCDVLRKRAFEIDSLDPYKLGDLFFEDLTKVAEECATNDRHKEVVRLARDIYGKEKSLSTADFRRALSKPNREFYTFISQSIEEVDVDPKVLNAQINQFNLFDRENIHLRHKAGDKENLLYEFHTDNCEGLLYTLHKDVITSELLGIIEATGNKRRKCYDSFRMIWERFHPEEYDLRKKGIAQKGNYTAKMKRDADVLSEAVRNSDSCLRKDSVRFFTEDPGTLNLVYFDKEEARGYARFYLMEKIKTGEPVLTLDTIEVDHKQFDINEDVIRFLGLASCYLCIESNVGEVLGQDARIKNGIRQAFGNKELIAPLRKIGYPSDFRGQPMQAYTFIINGSTGIWESKNNQAYVIMHNWRRNMK